MKGVVRGGTESDGNCQPKALQLILCTIHVTILVQIQTDDSEILYNEFLDDLISNPFEKSSYHQEFICFVVDAKNRAG